MGTDSHISMLPRLAGAALFLGLIACGDGVVTPGDGAIARLEALAGNGQRATVGEPVPQPLIVQAVDREGRPVTGVDIAFRFINTDGAVTPGVTTTGSDGRAKAQVTLGGSIGDQVVEARSVDESGVAVEFQLTGLQRKQPAGGGGGAGGGGPPAGGGGDDGGNGGNGGNGGSGGSGGGGHDHGGQGGGGSAGGSGGGGGGSAGGGDGGGSGGGHDGGGENGSGGGHGGGDDGGQGGGGHGGGNGGGDGGGHGHHHGGKD
jgi:hypothetical protein